MRTHTKVAAAVATALISTAASATSIFAPINSGWDVTLNVAGSSAARDAIILDFDQILCDRAIVGTYTDASGNSSDPSGNAYTGDSLTLFKVSGDGDLRAFSCQFKNPIPTNANGVSASLAGKKVLVYYRSDGGSVWGLIGAVRGTSIIRADLSNTSNFTSVYAGTATDASGNPLNDASKYNYGTITGTYGICANTTQTVDGDATCGTAATTASGGVALDTVLVGVEDVGPEQFTTSTNWPTAIGVAGAALSSTELSTAKTNDNLTYGQIFGVIVNKKDASGNVLFTASSADPAVSNESLTTADLQGIFSNNYASWSSVKSITTASTAAIGVCRRDIGSGSHVAIATHFLKTGCGANVSVSFKASGFAGGAPYNTGPLYNPSTGKELACVNNNPATIGYSSFDDTASFVSGNANVLFVKIDGVAPSKLSAATGAYPLWEELHFTKNAASIPASGLVTDLAGSFVGLFQTAPAPVAANGISLAKAGAVTNTVTNPAAGPNWVAYGKRGATGLACLDLANYK